MPALLGDLNEHPMSPLLGGVANIPSATPATVLGGSDVSLELTEKGVSCEGVRICGGDGFCRGACSTFGGFGVLWRMIIASFLKQETRGNQLSQTSIHLQVLKLVATVVGLLGRVFEGPTLIM